MEKTKKNFGKYISAVSAILLLSMCVSWFALSDLADTTLQMGTPTTPGNLEAQWAQGQEERLPGVVGKISINDAGQEALEALPGVGEKTAVKIIAYRQENGPFLFLEDIMKVSGIGEKKFEQMKEFITL